MNCLEINMTDFKIGTHVYEIFDPRNNGLVIQLGIDDVIVETRKGKVSYKTNRITKDYHKVISTLIESVDEWRELWFQKKHECDALKEK